MNDGRSKQWIIKAKEIAVVWLVGVIAKCSRSVDKIEKAVWVKVKVIDKWRKVTKNE